MTHTAELAWAAGFLEGEGSFVAGEKRGQLTVAAVQKQLEPLARVQRILGGKIAQYSKPDGRAFYRWTVNGSWAVGVTFTLFTWLSPRRREQAKRLIAVWKSKPARNNSLKTECPHGHPYTPTNVYLNDGHRSCKACFRLWGRNRRPWRQSTARGSTPEPRPQHPVPPLASGA